MITVVPMCAIIFVSFWSGRNKPLDALRLYVFSMTGDFVGSTPFHKPNKGVVSWELRFDFPYSDNFQLLHSAASGFLICKSAGYDCDSPCCMEDTLLSLWILSNRKILFPELRPPYLVGFIPDEYPERQYFNALVFPT